MPSYYWKDRLEKLYAAGLNAVQTYVPWNFHESQPGVYDFDGDRDIVQFIETAQEVGLLVILRPGPYIDAEWDMGGLPSWLLRDKSIALGLRTSDPNYLKFVDKWLSVLLQKVKPLLYENGGPIIAVQVENEYGSYYACDKTYLQLLEATFRLYLGPNVVLFTTDGATDHFLKCGTLPSLYATIDFGITSNPAQFFKLQREYEPRGPLVNSEFYTGWLDYWGHPHQTRNSTQVAETLDAILKLNASVNMYMFEGGTNYAFWNGADAPNAYLPVPTSYDYDAPLTEAGDPWEKFTMVREVINKYKPVPSHVPVPSPTAAYGKVHMTEYAELFHCPQLVVNETVADDPVPMEILNQNFGFVVYSTNFSGIDEGVGKLTLYGLHDRASVYVGGQLQGTLMRMKANVNNLTINISIPSREFDIDIVVENMGRISYGSLINDSKGIMGGVSLNDEAMKGWKSKSIPLGNISQIPFEKLNGSAQNAVALTFYRGTFEVKGQPNDTYLSMKGWSKGQAFVNGFNLGRYWPVRGPQKTLYVPANLLKASPATNELVLFEIDSAPCKKGFESCFATLVATPDVGLA